HKVHEWATPGLDDAYRLRADAEAVFFAPGYAPADEAGNRLRKAEAACRRVKEAADQVRAAESLWESAADWLAGATPLVTSGAIPFPIAEELAAVTRQLGDGLSPPSKPLDLDSFAARAADLERPASAVRVALAAFSRPLQADALAKLRARAEAADGGEGIVSEINSILATPLVAV
ncbi:MAG TPA: hypothetical protein VLM40_06075, partial [Gemmata sp.]|nr:hypothetical protein [Gemmata sp.]